jgi:hypothetical protein
MWLFWILLIVVIVMGTVGVFVMWIFSEWVCISTASSCLGHNLAAKAANTRDRYSLYAAGSLLWGIHNPTGSLALIVSAGLG